MVAFWWSDHIAEDVKKGNATCPDTFATTFLSSCLANPVQLITEQSLELHKLANIRCIRHFVPVGIETSGIFGRKAMIFLKELVRKVEEECTEEQSFPYLLQGIFVAIQHSNTAAVLDSSCPWDSNDY